MLLRRIQAPTLAEAVAKTRTECGEDALLVETKRQRNGYVIVAARNQDSIAAPAEAAVELPRAGATYSRGFRDVAQRARHVGVSDPLLQAVEHALAGTSVRLDVPGDPALPEVARRILAGVIRTAPLPPLEHKVVAFVGTTGVGKTTTLAKIAAHAVHRAGERVVIATLDTYRLAAVEQLRAYADLLGVPCEVAFTPQDLRRCVSEHAGADRILVDTSGRSPHDERPLRMLASALRAADACSVLCVPATARRRDTAAVLDAYQPLDPVAAVVTKWDETDQPFEATSLLIERGVPLASVTIGQEVPDDILGADANQLAAQALTPDTHPLMPNRA